jgi:hypothetical protein
LGEITIKLPRTFPRQSRSYARFDYIHLVDVKLPSSPLTSGATMESEWTWQPQPSNYRDNYIATVRYVDPGLDTVLRIDFDLGSREYPSSDWSAGYPVTQRVKSILPDQLPPGLYDVQISLTRASDGKLIPARRYWPPWPVDYVHVGKVEITAAPP